MADPKFSLKMRTGQEEKEGDVQLKAGTTLEVEVEDSAAGVDVDYTSEEAMILTVNGKVGLKGLRLEGSSIGGSLSHDFITSQTSFDGKLELTFPKDVAVSVNTKLAPGNKSVGAVITIKL